MTTAKRSPTYELPSQPPLLGNEESDHHSSKSTPETKIASGGPFLFSSVRALRDFVEHAIILPYALQTEANRCLDGSHVVSGKLVWSMPGQYPIPYLATQTGRPRVIPILIDVEREWQPRTPHVQRVKSAQNLDGDGIEVMVTGGVVPTTAIRAFLVPDTATADNVRTVFPDYGNGVDHPTIRVVPGLFTVPMEPIAPPSDSIDGNSATDRDRRLVASLDRIIGAASLAANALPHASAEVAKQFFDLVSFGLAPGHGEGSSHASLGAVIGTELAITPRNSDVPPLANADARLIAAAVRVISKVSPPSNFVPLKFVQELQDALSDANASSSNVRSPAVAALVDLAAALKNELDWDVAWSKMQEPSLQAVATVARASSKHDALAYLLQLSPISPEATLLAYALSGCLHRLTGIHQLDRPRGLVTALTEVGARIITRLMTGQAVADVSVRLETTVSGDGVGEWRLLVNDDAAHSWTGSGPEVGAVRGEAEFAAYRAYDQVDEGVRHLIELASIREAACVRLREAKYLGRADEREARHQRDDADLHLRGQLARLLEEYAERDRLLEAFKATRQTREPHQA